VKDTESHIKVVQAYYLAACQCVCVCVRACGTVLHSNSAVTLVGGNRLNALSVGVWCRSAFMDLYSRMLEYPFFFSLSREMWGHYRQIDNDRLHTNSCLFTIHDYAPIRFAACKTANFIRTFHRIRVFWNVSPCRLVDGMVCYENLPLCAGFHERHAGWTFCFSTRDEILWKSDRRFSRRYRVTHKARRMSECCLSAFSFWTLSQICKKKKTQLAASYLSVYLSKWNKSAPTGRILMKFDIWVFLKNLWKIFKLHQNPTSKTGTLDEDLCTLMIISHRMHLRMRDVSDKICREKSNTRFIFSNCFSHKSRR
jgi:hypothetical protein